MARSSIGSQEQDILFGAVLAQELSDPASRPVNDCSCYTPCIHRYNVFTAITGVSATEYVATAMRILQAIYHTHDLVHIKKIRLAFRCTLAVSESLRELTLKKL